MKDPAFLFYPGDWQGGTVTMSRHLKGCYMDLLIAQFNSGPLSLEEIKTVLGTDFAAWGSLSKKFKQNPKGLFFNERLDAEKTKRLQFSAKQKERINKRWYKSGIQSGNTVVLPIENENRNEDEIEVKKKGGVGENMLLPEMFNVWQKENPKYKPIREDDFTGLRKIAEFISGRKGIEHLVNGERKNLMETWGKWCKYIRNSTMRNESLLTIGKFKLQKIHNEILNGTYQQTVNGYSAKTGTSDARIEAAKNF